MTPVQFPQVAEFEAIPIADRLYILDQVARYAWAFDSGSLEGYLGRFWPDGILEHPKRDGTPGVYEGHEGIRTFIRDFEGREMQSWGHQHQISSGLMDLVSEDEIEFNAYCAVLRHEFHRSYWPTGSAFRVGTWHANFTRREGAWRIARLQIKMWTDVSIGSTGTALAEARELHAPGERQ